MILRTVRHCFELITPGQRTRWLRLVPLIVLTGGLEMLGASGIFILIRLLTDPFAVNSIGWLDLLRGAPLHVEEPKMALVVACLVAAVFAAKNGLRLFEAYQRQVCIESSSTELLCRMFDTYLRAPYSVHLRRSPSHFVRNLQEGVEAVASTGLQAATIIASEVFIAISLLVVFVWASTFDALAIAVAIGAITLATVAGIQRPIVAWGKSVHQTDETKLDLMRFGFDSVREIRIFGAIGQIVGQMRQARGQQSRALIGYGTMVWVPRLVVESLFVGGIAALVYRSSLDGGEPWRLAPTIGVFAYAALRLLPSFYLIAYHAGRIQNSAAAIDQVYRDFEELSVGSQTSSAESVPRPFTSSIRLDGVGYTYSGADRPALVDINLLVRPGESLGIIGDTGAGKSTMLNLLLGLAEPSTGSFTIDGREALAELEEWQSRVGYVPQEISLMNGTVRDNIVLGTPSDQIDESRITQAVDAAQLKPTINGLADGLDTRVGDRGTRLSGGERQRLAIARALYRNPEVLIFDEITSALDPATESELADAIDHFHGNKTVIIVAHRMRLVKSCDHVVVLEKGRVAAEGTYEDLVRSDTGRRLGLESE